MRGLPPAIFRMIRTCALLRVGVSVLLLIGLSGAHWWILQSVAWSGMIVSYSAQSGLIKGVEETFDGDHPCTMCKAIEQARESESKSTAALASTQKSVELLGLPPQSNILLTRSHFHHPAITAWRADRLNSPPPVPPPRTLPA